MTREETKRRFQAWCQREIGNNCSKEDYAMFNNIMALLEQEPCEDAISKESLLARLRLNYSKNQNVSLQALVDIVNTEQPITPARRVGKWIVLRDEYDDIVEAVCSCCDANGNHKWEWCPHCGAEMRGVKG